MPGPADLITVAFGGKTFRCSRRTAAHLEWTAERLADRDPAARIVVIQPPYNTGVEASAGTHDYDAVLDVQIVGMGWSEAQRFLRECGWAAWHREPPTFSHHIHMVSIGYPGKVGIYVPGQVADYYARRSGLKGHAADPSWHPADIDSTIFDFERWEAANMPLNKDDLDAVRAVVRDELSRLGEVKIDVGAGSKWSLSRVLTVLRRHAGAS